MSSRAVVLVALATAACAGGGGSFSQLDTQDRAPISNESVSSSTEGSSNTSEGVSNSAERAGRSVESSGAGGFACAGTYRCTVDGRTASSTIVLGGAAGGCFAVTDDDGTTLASDGTIRQNGKVVATWSTTGNGFSYSVTTTVQGQPRTTTINCTKISDSVAPVGDDDDDDERVDDAPSAGGG